MADPSAAAEPLAAREYLKLFTAASKAAQVFSVREKNQLDVYGVWAVLRNQLNTDDSFQFNKVILLWMAQGQAASPPPTHKLVLKSGQGQDAPGGRRSKRSRPRFLGRRSSAPFTVPFCGSMYNIPCLCRFSCYHGPPAAFAGGCPVERYGCPAA
jgi:hypothetical protein